jgi:2-hydroxy-3-oxopropionate reductase
MAREQARRVGVIGLGVIGKPIAQRLVSGGFEVAVYDVRAEPMAELSAAGAKACGSPAEVAKRSEIIVSLVSDAAQTSDVVTGANGVLETVVQGSVFVVGSTLGPAPVHEVAAALRNKDCDTLDAPISGGYLAAAEGKLSVMAGGSQATLDRALPALRAFAQSITLAGDVGAGQTAKLAHQLVCSVNVMTLLEGLALGVAGGVEPAVLKQILREGIADSAVLRLWDDLSSRWKGMLAATPADVTPPNLRKDLHLALEYARELGVNLYIGTQASLIADSGHATGRDDPRL